MVLYRPVFIHVSSKPYFSIFSPFTLCSFSLITSPFQTFQLCSSAIYKAIAIQCVDVDLGGRKEAQVRWSLWAVVTLCPIHFA